MMRRSIAYTALLFSTTFATVNAHEFMVVPAASQVPAGDTLAVSLIMTETWIQPDRMPPPENVTLERLAPGGRIPIPLVPADQSLDAEVVVPSEPLVLVGTLIRDRIETPKVPEGAGPVEGRMTRSAVFSKSFVNLEADSQEWSRPVGTRLEIVPLTNPATLDVGDMLAVKTLFDGQPVVARVQATFDGEGAKGHGLVVRAESGPDGIARVPITRPGLWLVRAKHRVDESRDGYLHYAGGANIIFRVD